MKSIGVVTSRRMKGDQESLEVRYYLSSLPVEVELFARAVRGHVVGGERVPLEPRCDLPRGRRAVAGASAGLEHTTWLYRFTLSILKQHPDPRMSLINEAHAPAAGARSSCWKSLTH